MFQRRSRFSLLPPGNVSSRISGSVGDVVGFAGGGSATTTAQDCERATRRIGSEWTVGMMRRDGGGGGFGDGVEWLH